MTGESARDRLIVALDLDVEPAIDVARRLQGAVRWVKIGMTLFYQQGPGIVATMRDLGFEVFLDLKLHDIPHQVEGAAERVGRLGAGMLTVHASGGQEMIAAAVAGASRGARAAGTAAPSVIAVTVLTSMDDAGLSAVGVERAAAQQVELLARIAAEGEADGVVCSPHEAARMRAMLGPDALVVTPGVRPAGSDVGDQARIATPLAALQAGASHLVIGRPITGAADPAAAVEDIVNELDGARA